MNNLFCVAAQGTNIGGRKMERKTLSLIIGITVWCFSGPSLAGPGYIEQARVIEAQPVYESVEVSYPVTECRMERDCQSSISA